MPADRSRALHVRRLRDDARHARDMATQVTTPADLRHFRGLADDWDRQADTLEKTVNDNRLM